MVMLWSLSGYEMTTNNLNLFWAWPPHLIAAFIGYGTLRRSRALRIYFLVSAAAAVLFAAAIPLLPQTVPSAAIPLIVALALRGAARGTARGAARGKARGTA